MEGNNLIDVIKESFNDSIMDVTMGLAQFTLDFSEENVFEFFPGSGIGDEKDTITSHLGSVCYKVENVLKIMDYDFTDDRRWFENILSQARRLQRRMEIE